MNSFYIEQEVNKFIQDYLKIKLNEKLENRIHDKKCFS